MAFRIISLLLFIGILTFAALKVQQLFGVSSGTQSSRTRKGTTLRMDPRPSKPVKFTSVNESSSKVTIDRLSNGPHSVSAAPGTGVIIEKESGKRFTLTTQDGSPTSD